MTVTKAPRAAIYARISSVRGTKDVEKAPAQVAACMRLAEDSGYEVVATFREADGTSATTGAPRPQFKALLELVSSGAVDVVLATETERLVRSDEDGLALRLACSLNGTDWHTLRGGRVEVSSASGALIATLTAAIGRYESKTKSERQRATYDRKRSEGLPHPGPRVFGWKAGRMEIEPVEAEMIRQGTADLLAHGKVYRVVKSWNDSGVLTTRGKAWTYAGVQQVLSRARNAGLSERDGDPRGRWDQIVSEEDWRAVRAILRDPSRRVTAVRESRWMLAGIARCVCGAPMRSTVANGRPYYRCSTTASPAARDGGQHVGIPAKVLDQVAAAATVRGVMYGPTDADLGDDDERRLVAIHDAVRQCAQGIQRLVEAVESGALELDDVASRRRALEERRDGLLAERDEIARRNASAALLAHVRRDLWTGGRVDPEQAAKARAEVAAKFEELALDQKRALVRAYVDVRVNPGKGSERVDVVHKVATTLNEHADAGGAELVG